MTCRLASDPIQAVDRERELRFSYRGSAMKGLRGDTVATALFANGIRIFSRSLKYHRPRGLYNLDGYSSHCMMSVNGVPNVRACSRRLESGMVVQPQNVIGSPQWDVLSVLQWFHALMPAGFYYRRFHKPAWIWPLAQKFLRWAAGTGSVDLRIPDGIYENRYLNAEVCIVGGGAAGMAAALAAAKAGVRVIILERKDRLGGSLTYRKAPIHDGAPAYLHGQRLADAVSNQENVRILLRTTATSIYQSNHITALQAGGAQDSFRLRTYEIRARSVVIATGAIERPLIFENNDAPGIMQGSCAHQLAHTYGLRPGKRAVLSGCHDGLLEVAADLSEAGVEVLAVADLRREGFDEEAVSRLNLLGVPFLPGHVVTKARQFRTLKGAVVGSVDEGKHRAFDCDLLVASAGEIPLSQLLSVAGARMAYDSVRTCFLPRDFPPGLHAAGRVRGLDHAESIEAQGKEAGLAALQDVGVDVCADLKAAGDRLASMPSPKAGWDGVEPPSRGYWRFVSFDEDVTVKQVAQAMEDGFDHPELLKRYTAAGTGPSQSYLSGHNLALLMAARKGLQSGAVAPTTVRPPLVPTSLAALAGRQNHPVKRTPVHREQKALGGTFRLAGEWERVRHFTDEKAHDEILNVRKNVGFIDVSTLGKFRVRGPDALKLLQRVYVNDITKVAQGKLTYSVMCNEEGVVIDDGVMTKLGDGDYFFTTSTLRAPYTAEWLGFHSREEDWDAGVINLTDAFAAINLAGPRSREVLKRLTDADVSNEAFPFMGFRRVTLCGDIEALIARIGFVGEICYEIHVPASYGPALQEAIVAAGKEWGIQPFGLEAQAVLRLEKGHVIIVVDTDNHTTLHEIGLSRIWARHKTDAKTVGVPALRFAEGQTHREKLVGFMMEERSLTPPDGSIVVADGVVKGRVCTSRYSPTLEQSIGMALVEPDLAVTGGFLDVYMDGKLVKGRLPALQTRRARIVPMPFYDPKGERLRR